MNATCANAVQDLCFSVTSNPDISGIGIRIGIYVTTVLNMIVASLLSNNVQLTRDTIRTSYILSLGLITAGIIQSNTGGLSLLDALITTMLSTIITIFAGANYFYIKSLGLSINLCSVLFFGLWTYWGLQIWSNPRSFGLPSDLSSILPDLSPISPDLSPISPDSSPGLNCTANLDTVFVVLGKSIGATNSGLRIFAIVVFSLGAVPSAHTLGTVVWWVVAAIVAGEVKVRARELARNVKKEKYNIDAGPGKTRIHPMGGVVGIVILIYTIITTEQIVHRNSVGGTLSQWTFGQTLSVIVLLQQLLEIGLAVKEEIEFKKVKETWRTPRDDMRFDGV